MTSENQQRQMGKEQESPPGEVLRAPPRRRDYDGTLQALVQLCE
jgi:hypothetical protein